jgi:glutamyl-tRNA reductase
VSFLSVGISHDHAPLDLLERVTIPEDEFGKVLGALLANANIQEAVVVSTCLRTEVYAVIDRFHGAVDEITATLAAHREVDADELAEHRTIQFDRGVANHLFRVAAGLKSVVPGEFEVLGQLRRSLERAEEEHAVGPELSELFQRSMSAGRRVRAETAIARGTTSFAQATVDLVRRQVGSALTTSSVSVVGAGQLAEGVVRGLVGLTEGPATIAVVNRTFETAQAMTAPLGDGRVTVAPWDDLLNVVRSSAITVFAADVPEVLVTAGDLDNRERLIVDLGMPRCVDASVDSLSLTTRLDIAHLESVVRATLADRHAELDAADDIVTIEIEKYLEDRRSRGAAAIVSEFRELLEGIRVAEIDRRASDVADFTPEQREKVESLTRSLIAKIAHTPTLALKEAAGTDRGLRLTEALRNLFDLG